MSEISHQNPESVDQKIKEIEKISKEIEDQINTVKNSVEDILSQISTDRLKAAVEEIKLLVYSWENVVRCLNKRCKFVVRQYEDSYEVELGLPITIIIPVSKLKSLESVYEDIKVEIMNNFVKLLLKTSEVIKETLSEYEYALADKLSSVEKLYREIEFLSRKQNEIHNSIIALIESCEKEKESDCE